VAWCDASPPTPAPSREERDEPLPPGPLTWRGVMNHWLANMAVLDPYGRKVRREPQARARPTRRPNTALQEDERARGAQRRGGGSLCWGPSSHDLVEALQARARTCSASPYSGSFMSVHEHEEGVLRRHEAQEHAGCGGAGVHATGGARFDTPPAGRLTDKGHALAVRPRAGRSSAYARSTSRQALLPRLMPASTGRDDAGPSCLTPYEGLKRTW